MSVEAEISTKSIYNINLTCFENYIFQAKFIIMNFSSENSFAFKRFLKDQEVFIEKLLNPLEFNNIDQKFELGNNTRVAIIFDRNFT